MPLRPAAGALWLAVVLAAVSANAVSAAPLSATQARAIVGQVIGLIARNYVRADRRAGIAADLEAKEAAGRYDLGDAASLADRLSTDIGAAGHDGHLWFSFDPVQNSSLRDPHFAVRYYADLGRRRNHGYEQMRILPGNIRYADVSSFIWNGAATAQATADVARFLAGGDAAIIDLRQNGGGDVDAEQMLLSYFLPPDNRVLMIYHSGATGAVRATHVLGELDGPRLVGKPLYVLMSDATASVAEEFAYQVAQFHLGTLVGHASAGAANNNTLYAVGTDYVLSVSTGWPEHPVSHGNWEGSGVIPDLAVPADSALDQAQRLALQALAARPGAGSYAWALAGIEGKLDPPALDAQALAAYVGVYGVCSIVQDKTGLILERQGREPTALTPLAPDLFALADTVHKRLRFRRDHGRVSGFDLLSDRGGAVPTARAASDAVPRPAKRPQ